MAEETESVFSSVLPINKGNLFKNNLHELFPCVIAKPVDNPTTENSDIIIFKPRIDKVFIPKRKPKGKVKTLRQVKKEFEEYIYKFLTSDLDKQRRFLLKKIRQGSSRDEETVSLSRKIIKSENPVSRIAWEMLTNINPERHSHPKQYVLYNGEKICVNGAKGGNKTFLINCDIGAKYFINLNKKKPGSNLKRKTLLQSSLDVNFKPGPLSKKIKLDMSHQKCTIGETKLVKLPEIVLEISPRYGACIEPYACGYIKNSLTENKDILTEDLAKFVVSALGSIVNENPVQVNCSSYVFPVKYYNDQRKILMREFKPCDVNNDYPKIPTKSSRSPESDTDIDKVVTVVLNEIVNCIEIGNIQDTLYSHNEDLKTESYDNYTNAHVQSKEKLKNRYIQLQKLAVTVIQCKDQEVSEFKKCNKSFCQLGCICSSLEGRSSPSNHCGKPNCMFECKCNLTKFGDNEYLPGIITDLNHQINSKLAKEEQKFHQTVVFTEDKCIVLGKRRRNNRMTEKYKTFCDQMGILPKNENEKQIKICAILVNSLPINSVEPWCMVHNLYKCFCKGRYVESFIKDVQEEIVEHIQVNERPPEPIEEPPMARRKLSSATDALSSIIISGVTSYAENYNHDDASEVCARTEPFEGRNYTPEYYILKNQKIFEMEKNDKLLNKRLMERQGLSNEKLVLIETEPLDQIISVESETNPDTKTVEINNVTKGVKMSDWLEKHYKILKERANSESFSFNLGAPVLGKVTLYPWEGIIHRFQNKKNFFLVSDKEPFRLYIAVERQLGSVRNCINLVDICCGDIERYPQTIKNILSNTLELKGSFFILYGRIDCWEIVGSVTKVKESPNTVETHSSSQRIDNTETNEQHPKSSTADICLKSLGEIPQLSCEPSKVETSPSYARKVTSKSLPNVSQFKGPFLESQNLDLSIDNNQQDLTDNLDTQNSRWFVMSVGTDFTEMQFHKRGFFVKYERIIKAIEDARVSGETVLLSAQVCAKEGTSPQFGIYAIPENNDTRVFIGPYGKSEDLGFEIMKTTDGIKSLSKTGGYWLVTKKVDNATFLENPLSFLSKAKVDMANEQNRSLLKTDIMVHKEVSHSTSFSSKQAPKKISPIKPIKISKNNSFFQLANTGVLTPVSLLKSSNIKPVNVPTLKIKEQHIVRNLVLGKPLPVLFPNDQVSTKSKTITSGMVILNPKEINQRVLKTDTENSSSTVIQDPSTVENDLGLKIVDIKSMDVDIEHFIQTNIVTPKPIEIGNISEDEDGIKNIWLESNIANLGYIKGKRKDGKISFAFPGFKMTTFYKETEAFSKINQVLSRKVCIPQQLKLEWRIVDKKAALKTKKMLTTAGLGPEFVITKQGIRRKKTFLLEQCQAVSSNLQTLSDPVFTVEDLGVETADMVTAAQNVLREQAKESKRLEEECQILLEGFDSKREQFRELFSQIPDGNRSEGGAELQEFLEPVQSEVAETVVLSDDD